MGVPSAAQIDMHSAPVDLFLVPNIADISLLNSLKIRYTVDVRVDTPITVQAASYREP
jgi:hypothetical protein